MAFVQSITYEELDAVAKVYQTGSCGCEKYGYNFLKYANSTDHLGRSTTFHAPIDQGITRKYVRTLFYCMGTNFAAFGISLMARISAGVLPRAPDDRPQITTGIGAVSRRKNPRPDRECCCCTVTYS